LSLVKDGIWEFFIAKQHKCIPFWQYFRFLQRQTTDVFDFEKQQILA